MTAAHLSRTPRARSRLHSPTGGERSPECPGPSARLGGPACACPTRSEVEPQIAGILDLWAPLEEARAAAGDELYLRLDTHWTDRGAAVAVERVLEALRPGLWDPGALHPQPSAQTVGDLTTTLFGRRAAEETRPLSVVRDGDRTTREEIRLEGGKKHLLFRTTGPNPRLGKAVLLHDSFFEKTTTLLPPYFDEIRYFRDEVRDSEAMRAAVGDADVVIFTAAERSFYGNGWWRSPDTRAGLHRALVTAANHRGP